MHVTVLPFAAKCVFKNVSRNDISKVTTVFSVVVDAHKAYSP